MTACPQIARCPESVKSHLCSMFEESLDKLLFDDSLTPRGMVSRPGQTDRVWLGQSDPRFEALAVTRSEVISHPDLSALR